jgi:hypothetical protein
MISTVGDMGDQAATAEKPPVTTPGNDPEAQAPSQPSRGNRYSVFADGYDITVLRVIPKEDPHYPGALCPIDDAPRCSNMRDVERWLDQQEGLDGSEVAIVQFKLLGRVAEEKTTRVTFTRRPRIKIGDEESER